MLSCLQPTPKEGLEGLRGQDAPRRAARASLAHSPPHCHLQSELASSCPSPTGPWEARIAPGLGWVLTPPRLARALHGTHHTWHSSFLGLSLPPGYKLHRNSNSPLFTAGPGAAPGPPRRTACNPNLLMKEGREGGREGGRHTFFGQALS